MALDEADDRVVWNVIREGLPLEHMLNYYDDEPCRVCGLTAGLLFRAEQIIPALRGQSHGGVYVSAHLECVKRAQAASS